MFSITIVVLCVLVPCIETLPAQESPVGRSSTNVLTETDHGTSSEPNRIINLEKIVDSMHRNFTDLQHRFEEYRQNTSTKTMYLQTRIQELERKLLNITSSTQQKIRVGFSASVTNKLQNVKLGTKVKFDNVYYQSGGNAYDKRTGIFTAPINGLYLFSIFCHSSDAKTLVMSVRVDGASRSVCVSEPAFAGEDDTGGNMFVTSLNQGQQVWVETYEMDDVSIYPSFTTFSGVLIQ